MSIATAFKTVAITWMRQSFHILRDSCDAWATHVPSRPLAKVASLGPQGAFGQLLVV